MSGTLEARIQAQTKAYRDSTVAGMTENQVRTEAQTRGIDGYATTPVVTLREEIVQHYRNRLRKNAYTSPVTEVSPSFTAGNPGNDWATLSDA